MRFPYRIKFFLFGEKGSLLCAENREMINRVLKEKEMDNKDLKDGDNGGFSNMGQTILIILIAATVTFFIYSLSQRLTGNGATQELTYTQFLSMVDRNLVEKVEWSDGQITVYPKYNAKNADGPAESDAASKKGSATEDLFPGLGQRQGRIYFVIPVGADAEKLVERLYLHNVDIVKKRPNNSGFILQIVLSVVLPFVLLFWFMNWMAKRVGGSGGGLMGVGKSNAKMYMQKETGISFKDVAGEDEAKESLVEIVDFLHNPTKYTAIGAKLPKGALLVGPPGTGKTLVMGATNRPEILDPALLRPGRFDRRIIVEKPDLKGRVNILKVHAKDVKLDETVNFDEIALATSGAVGADLANMMNESAITAVKHGREKVSQKDLFEAVEVVLVGKEKKDRILSKEERRIVSYHEVGHALVAAIQKDSEPVQKITIVPRTMGTLGYVMQVPEEEKYLNTKSELHAMIVEFLAGRAAEELVFETVTTGASNDIEKATKIARAMVTQYGMSEKFGLMGLARQENMYLGGRAVLECGDDTATEVDEEVSRILKECYEESKKILSENRYALDEIAEFLIEKETITGKEFMKILSEVKEKRKKELAGSSVMEKGTAETTDVEKKATVEENEVEKIEVEKKESTAEAESTEE